MTNKQLLIKHGIYSIIYAVTLITFHLIRGVDLITPVDVTCIAAWNVILYYTIDVPKMFADTTSVHIVPKEWYSRIWFIQWEEKVKSKGQEIRYHS